MNKIHILEVLYLIYIHYSIYSLMILLPKLIPPLLSLQYQDTPFGSNLPFTELDFNELVKGSSSQTDPDEEFWGKYNSKQKRPVKKQ